MKKAISIVIPTFNNPEYLNPCVDSIIKTGILNDLAELKIVNNGKQNIKEVFGWHPAIEVYEPGENLGWEGGLDYAIKRTDTPFLCFQNDDTFLPSVSSLFYQRLLTRFANPNVAAVGPSTTVAAGLQSVYHPNAPRTAIEVAYLIFFTVMVRRSHLEAVGGIDTTLPGGDDLDLSIRFRKAGHHVVLDPAAFIIHHGFKTGTRVRGDSNRDGGWNSPQMTDRTNQYLIRKHGFKDFIGLWSGLNYEKGNDSDLEGDIVRSLINGEENVLELGCGGKKTVEKAIGIDRVAKGQPIPHLPGTVSVADIIGNVEDPLPIEPGTQDAIIARHILEHCIDSVGTVNRWKSVLRPGGKLIVAVPNETITASIPLNFEHVHAFTPESLRSLMGACGLREVKSLDSGNGVSFVGCYERMN